VRVSVAVAWPSRQEVIELELGEGSTVADALEAVRACFAEGALDGLRTGIWSRPCAADTPLREGDRVELYRPLIADAKQMRRARAGRRR
jgi:hypothetical protein